MYSDFLLIRKMKQGEDTAFDEFVRKYYPEILNYCYYHCMDKSYAEDLTQETFVRFFAKLSGYHCRGKTLNYLYTIAGNLCIDYSRKIKEIPVEKEELTEERYLQEYEADQVLNKIFIAQVLGQLPQELADVVSLYYFQELKLTEIADALQIGLPLVKYRLRRARKQLQEFGKKEGSGYEKRKENG